MHQQHSGDPHQSLTKDQAATRGCRHANTDDIVIATETIEDHIVRIKQVFESLREAGFKIGAEKCNFMHTETKYPGRVVSVEGIKPDP